MLRKKQKIRKIDSPLYKYWQALFLSFYSSKLYIDVVKRWKGFGIKYLIFFLLIACIPLAIKNTIMMNSEIQYGILDPVYLIPKFKIENGQVKFSEKMPYFIKNSLGKTVVIIDTTGSINEIKDEYPDLLILINSNKMYFRFPKLAFLKNDQRNAEFYNAQKVNVHDFTNVLDDEFDGKEFIEESDFVNIKKYFLATVYPITVFGFFGMLISAILALSIMGQVVSYSIFKYKLTYKQTSRVSVIATCIGVGIYLNLKAFDIFSPKITFLCVVIAFIYFSFGVLVVKRDSKHLVHY